MHPRAEQLHWHSSGYLVKCTRMTSYIAANHLMVALKSYKNISWNISVTYDLSIYNSYMHIVKIKCATNEAKSELSFIQELMTTNIST